MNNKFLFDQLFGSPVCEGDANSLHRKQDVPTLTIFLEEGGEGGVGSFSMPQKF